MRIIIIFYNIFVIFIFIIVKIHPIYFPMSDTGKYVKRTISISPHADDIVSEDAYTNDKNRVR